MKLKDQVFFVTGGASGLGAATASALVAAGARVVICDLPDSRGEETAQRLGDAVQFAPADITDADGIACALVAAEATGAIRGVVHCAGRGGDRLRILDQEGQPEPFDSFRSVLEVNLVGTYNVLRLAGARMALNEPLDGERGAIVHGQIGQAAYTASKAGIHALTLVAARELASVGIRVNTIAPGVLDTPMLARLPQKIRDSLASSVPFPQRLGHEGDYASLALELLQNSYLNAETIRLDGGIRMALR